MGINSTAMRILIEKGLSIHDILEVAEALEGHIPERFKARQKVEASKNSSDPHIRPSSSSWKKRAFNRIAERDGLISRDRQGRYELVMLKRGRVSEPRVRRNSITPRLRSKILSRRRCAYCGTTQGPFHVEHIHPIARGGSNAPSNLECACVPCNMSKGSKLLSEWMRAGK